MSVKVSVVVPVRDGAGELGLCLDALQAQVAVPGGVEVLVADDGSAAPPYEVVADRGEGFRLLVLPPRGSYAARNEAASGAVGDLLAFTDADCRPQPDWLLQAVQVLDERPDVDAVAGQVRLDLPAGRPRRACEWFEWLEGFPQERYVAWGFGVTANLVVRRHVHTAVGGFDGGALSGGDLDFGRRLRAGGHRLVYVPTAVVVHPVRSSWREQLRKTRRTTRGVVRLAHLDGRTPRGSLAYLLRQLSETRRLVRVGVRDARLHGPSARVRFLLAVLVLRSGQLAQAVASEVAWTLTGWPSREGPAHSPQRGHALRQPSQRGSP